MKGIDRILDTDHEVQLLILRTIRFPTLLAGLYLAAIGEASVPLLLGISLFSFGSYGYFADADPSRYDKAKEFSRRAIAGIKSLFAIPAQNPSPT